MATLTLKDFLGNYVRTQKIENGTAGFASWLAAQENGPDATYRERLRQADIAYARALPTYGATGEKLAGAGLDGSGYAAYLKSAAYNEKQRAKTAASEGYLADMKSASSGYAAYLSAVAKEKENAYRRVRDEIGESGILDIAEAKDYAVAAGFDEETAAKVADEGVAAATRTLKSNALKTALAGNMTKDAAILYAKSLGLSDEDAREIGAACAGQPSGKNTGYARIGQ